MHCLRSIAFGNPITCISADYHVGARETNITGALRYNGHFYPSRRRITPASLSCYWHSVTFTVPLPNKCNYIDIYSSDICRYIEAPRQLYNTVQYYRFFLA